MLVPVAVVGQAISVAALPVLSRLWEEGRRPEFDRLVLRTLQLGLVLSVFAAASFMVFAGPVVEIVYQRGRFTAGDAQRVAAILMVLSFAVPGWVTQQIGTRAFFARGDTWRPMLLGTAVALAVIPLYLLLGPRFGARGLAGAGAIGITLNALAIVALARRLHGAPSLVRLLATAVRSAAIAGAAALAASAVQPGVGGFAGALLDLGLGGAAFAAVAALGVAWLGDESMREGVARLLWRRARSREST